MFFSDFFLLFMASVQSRPPGPPAVPGVSKNADKNWPIFNFLSVFFFYISVLVPLVLFIMTKLHATLPHFRKSRANEFVLDWFVSLRIESETFHQNLLNNMFQLQKFCKFCSYWILIRFIIYMLYKIQNIHFQIFFK